MFPKHKWPCCESEKIEAVSKKRYQNQAGVICKKKKRAYWASEYKQLSEASCETN